MLFEKLEELEKRIREAYDLIAQLKYDKMELEIKCKDLEQKHNESIMELDMLRSERDRLGSRIEGLLDQFNGFKDGYQPREAIREIELISEGGEEEANEEAPVEAERDDLPLLKAKIDEPVEKRDVIQELPPEENEDNFMALFERGLQFEKKGMFQEAIEAYQKAIKLNPNYISAIEHLAFLLEKLNREREALPLWERVLALKK